MVKQGDLIYISFDPSVGHEQKKTRPALVVSNNNFNKRCGGLVMVCPISHANDFPLNIELPKGMKTDGKVLCGQLKTLDINARDYSYVESVSDDFLEYILEILDACLRTDG